MVFSFVPVGEVCSAIKAFAEENDTTEYATGCISDDSTVYPIELPVKYNEPEQL